MNGEPHFNVGRLVVPYHSELTFNFSFLFQGTGSAGATVRIYIEQFEPDVSKHDVDAQIALKPLIGLFLFCFSVDLKMSVMSLVMIFILVSCYRSCIVCIKAEGVYREGEAHCHYMREKNYSVTWSL